MTKRFDFLGAAYKSPLARALAAWCAPGVALARQNLEGRRPRPVALAVLSSALLSLTLSCVPWPHTVRTAPEISGTLERDGVPLAGVPLRVDTWDGPAHRTATNDAGVFSFPVTERWNFFVFFGDPIYEWRLVVDAPDAGTLWKASVMGYVPAAQRLTCETGEHDETRCLCSEGDDALRAGYCRGDDLQRGRDVCPMRPDRSIRSLTVFDGAPEERASLVPDQAQKHWGSWNLGYVSDAGRSVTVRCVYDDGHTEDVKLDARIERCDYEVDDAGAFHLYCGSPRG